MTRTNLIVGVGIILCAASVIWLEGRFAASDHEKGRKLVQTYHVEHRTESFAELLQRKHGGATGAWDSDVTEGCRGVVRVRWTVPGDPPIVYAWDVEIPTQEIYAVPESPSGKRLLEEFKAKDDALPPLELPALPTGGDGGA
jgi:hypothetical protein